jgi:hypothetical protein
MDKDEDKIIKVSPGKQYVRGDTRSEKIDTARNVSGSESKKRGEILDRMLREGHSPKTQAEYDDAYKKSSMLNDAYGEEVDKGYKSGGSVSMKSGGSVRGAGVAQRGQGKMRMF